MPRRPAAPTARRVPQSLAWCPLGPLDWDRLTAGLLPQEAGALMHLLMQAWGAAGTGEEPCTIPGEDQHLQLRTGLSAAWATHRDRVLHGWERLPSGRLRHVWLWQRWQEQLAKASKRATAGSAGASKKWRSHPTRTQGDLFGTVPAGVENPESGVSPTSPTNAVDAPEGMAMPSRDMAMPSPAMALPSPNHAEVVEGGTSPFGESTPPPVAVRAGAQDAPHPTAPPGPPPADDPARAAAERWLRERPAEALALEQRLQSRVTEILGPAPDGPRTTAARRGYHATRLALAQQLRAEVLLELHADWRAARSRAGPEHAMHGVQRLLAAGVA